MDVLEKYKKTWINQPEETNKVSKLDIYKMAHSKSSSIVKWIFIISILEFVILNVLSLFYSFYGNNKEMEKMLSEFQLENFFITMTLVSYAVIFYFIVRFYINYKNICIIEDTKTLMNKILKTRRTVKHYVLFNLFSMAFVMAILFYFIFSVKFASMGSQKVMISIIVSIVVILVAVLTLWLFYQLLYGILLKKLNRNYKELGKLGELN